MGIDPLGDSLPVLILSLSALPREGVELDTSAHHTTAVTTPEAYGTEYYSYPLCKRSDNSMCQIVLRVLYGRGAWHEGQSRN